jgi:hypothetical protein
VTFGLYVDAVLSASAAIGTSRRPFPPTHQASIPLPALALPQRPSAVDIHTSASTTQLDHLHIDRPRPHRRSRTPSSSRNLIRIFVFTPYSSIWLSPSLFLTSPPPLQPLISTTQPAGPTYEDDNGRIRHHGVVHFLASAMVRFWLVAVRVYDRRHQRRLLASCPAVLRSGALDRLRTLFSVRFSSYSLPCSFRLTFLNIAPPSSSFLASPCDSLRIGSGSSIA